LGIVTGYEDEELASEAASRAVVEFMAELRQRSDVPKEGAGAPELNTYQNSRWICYGAYGPGYGHGTGRIDFFIRHFDVARVEPQYMIQTRN
jgi:hypothetical protein